MKRFYFARNDGQVRFTDIAFESDMSKPQYRIDRQMALNLIAAMREREFWFAYAVYV